MGAGHNLAQLLPLLQNIPAVPGRLELVYTKLGKKAVVDYAHTPDALEKALTILRPYTLGKLLVVMGCGGDRDKGKRPQMGEIAARFADMVIVTDDNPRTEDAATIRNEVLTGCPQALNIAGRRVAIELALSQAQAGDLVLIAGKGHEKFQLIGSEKLLFDDTAVVREYPK